MSLPYPTSMEVQEAVMRAKEKARSDGVDPEHLDAVASTMAVLDILTSSSALETVSIQSATSGSRFTETFAEWSHQFDLQTHFDRFLAITVYLMEREGKETVTTSDIARMYEKAYWKKPANMADVFAKAAQKLYFASNEEVEEAEGLKAWFITRTGYNYLHTTNKEK